MWANVGDMIAYHESGPNQRMQRDAVQILDDGSAGKGQGLFQFEAPSFKTAVRRYKKVAEVGTFKLDDGIVNAKSILDLDEKQQYALLYANLIQDPDVNLKDYADGKLSLENLWLQGHKNVERKGNRNSFNESVEDAKKQNNPFGYYTYKSGGEKNMIQTYKDYVNGNVKNKNDKKVYDKLNRIHLKDARSSGMSVPNYIMTYL